MKNERCLPLLKTEFLVDSPWSVWTDHRPWTTAAEPHGLPPWFDRWAHSPLPSRSPPEQANSKRRAAWSPIPQHSPACHWFAARPHLWPCRCPCASKALQLEREADVLPRAPDLLAAPVACSRARDVLLSYLNTTLALLAKRNGLLLMRSCLGMHLSWLLGKLVRFYMVTNYVKWWKRLYLLACALYLFYVVECSIA